jgi:hypothetical protein
MAAISTKAAVVIRTILNDKNDDRCFGVQRDKKKVGGVLNKSVRPAGEK